MHDMGMMPVVRESCEKPSSRSKSPNGRGHSMSRLSLIIEMIWYVDQTTLKRPVSYSAWYARRTSAYM